jgi:hypothetical protein
MRAKQNALFFLLPGMRAKHNLSFFYWARAKSNSPFLTQHAIKHLLRMCTKNYWESIPNPTSHYSTEHSYQIQHILLSFRAKAPNLASRSSSERERQTSTDFFFGMSDTISQPGILMLSACAEPNMACFCWT